MFQFKSIRTKMLLGFSVVVFLVIFLGVYIFSSLSSTNEITENILEKELPLLLANEQLVIRMSNRIATSRGYIMTGDSSFKERFDEHSIVSEEAENQILQLGTSEEFNDLITRTAEWREFMETKVFEEYEKGNEDVAISNLTISTEESRDLMAAYTEAAKTRENQIIDLENESLASGKATLTIVSAIIIFVVLLSVLVAFITANSITKPIRVIMGRMGLIANGDLSSEPLSTNLKDEIGQLIVSTNEMSLSSHSLLNQINNVAETVSTQSEDLTQSANEVKAGTAQISITMDDLAAGSEAQANNSSNLASGMKTFLEKVMEANEDGTHIQQATKSVIEMTNEGSKLMTSSTKQMAIIDQIVHEAVIKVDGLDNHTQQISDLVSVIQNIADQTNLLALNAAIEAARAGEQGKGFAVVADEVRILAEESSNSVSNITDIVNQIQNESSLVSGSLRDGYKEVEEGTNQIAVTGKTFTRISEAVTEVAGRIQTISENLTNIADSSQEMSGHIQEIAAITEESAAGVEETSASSQQSSSAMEEVANSSNDLAGLAEELNTLVQQFKL